MEFYIPFLSEIHAKYSRSNLAIVAHAHLDHYPGIQNDPGRYSPDDSLTIQVQTSLEVLDAIISCYSKKPSIVLVGHSIGSWIILQVGHSQQCKPFSADSTTFPKAHESSSKRRQCGLLVISYHQQYWSYSERAPVNRAFPVI